ncbi:MAG: hypothetical protein R6V33_09175 [Pelovirga sp.]
MLNNQHENKWPRTGSPDQEVVQYLSGRLLKVTVDKVNIDDDMLKKIAVMMALFLWTVTMEATALAVKDGDLVPEPDLEQRMHWAAAYLAHAVTDSGRFRYRSDLTGEVGDNQKYNLLRHAGTLYAMAQYHSFESPDAFAAGALKRAAKYLTDHSVGPVGGRPDMLAVWSYPKLIGRPLRPLQAKLGGAGLALAALVQLEEILPGTTDLKMLQGLAEFLLFMQKSDGSFYSKYFSDHGRDDSWTSLYYPGEAALGLVMLFEIDGNPRWLVAAVDTLRYLARTREGLDRLPADHWALLATARLFKQKPEVLSSVALFRIPWDSEQDQRGVKQLLRDHAKRLVRGILSEQIQGSESACLNGGFNAKGRVTPAATRLEGLLAALGLLEEQLLRHRVWTAVETGIRFLADAQITTGPARGGFARYSPLCHSTARRANEIRIDYVQHGLAALYYYKQYGKTSPRRCTLNP